MIQGSLPGRPASDQAAVSGRELIVGVSGGIAAFKTATLVSTLVQDGAGVTVVMTAAAEKFVGQSTFAALTGRPVATEIFAPTQYPLGAHIELARHAELLCVAPATAHFLAQAALGLSDDLLSTLYLSFTRRVILAPAMNCDMWAKPAVQRNVTQLKDDGAQFVGPEEGWLSCREKGPGRMASPESILEAIQLALKSD